MMEPDVKRQAILAGYTTENETEVSQSRGFETNLQATNDERRIGEDGVENLCADANER